MSNNAAAVVCPVAQLLMKHSFFRVSPSFNRLGNHRMKLIIRNLARSTTEAELQAMFEAHGDVQYCNLVMDDVSNSSKGFAFVEMPRQGEAKAAMKTLNGSEVSGSTIRVKRA